jgi:hypothetical protein
MEDKTFLIGGLGEEPLLGVVPKIHQGDRLSGESDHWANLRGLGLFGAFVVPLYFGQEFSDLIPVSGGTAL